MTQAITERTEEEKTRLAQETVDYLNELLKASPEAIEHLSKYHTPCDISLSEHPTVQVIEEQSAQPKCVVGLLGIINGLVGARDGIGYIVGNYDDETGKLTRFSVTTIEQHAQLKGLPFPRTGQAVEDQPRVGAGWAHPVLSKKTHYFGVDHRSLCGKWAFSGEREFILDRANPLADQCKECFKRRAKALHVQQR